MEKTAKEDQIIEDLKLEIDSVKTKAQKPEKLQGQQEQYSGRTFLLVMELQKRRKK